MNPILKWSGVVALVIAIFAWYSSTTGSVPSFGGTTNYDEIDVAGIRIGANCNQGGNANCQGTRLGGVYAGTCALISGNDSVTASTTANFDCVVPNLVSTDGIEAQFGTSTAQALGWWIVGASASTTAGHATIQVANGSGATALVPAPIASSTQFEAFHVLTSAPGI